MMMDTTTLLTRLAVLYSADKWCLSVIGPFMMNLFLFRVWLHTCNLYYVLVLFAVTLAQSVWCLGRVRRRLGDCLRILDEPCWSNNPQLRRVQKILYMDFVKVSVLFNAVVSGTVVFASLTDNLPASPSQLQTSLDDIEEEFRYSTRIWGVPSSMVYVNMVHLVSAFLPLASLYSIERILTRSLYGISASQETRGSNVENAGDTQELPLTVLKSSAGRSQKPLRTSSQGSELALDMLCWSSLVSLRMCFSLCSYGTYEYYALSMTAMVQMLLCEHFILLVCVCAYFVYMKLKMSPHTAQV